MKTWSTEHSARLYGLRQWSQGYFAINSKGAVEVVGDKTCGPLDLFKLVQDLKARGVRLPILLRFSNIIQSRIELLHQCFDKAIKDENYKGAYSCVYPIKVNQQSHLVKEVVRFGQNYNMGLECGSKPELLITLALTNNNQAFIVCNGFKDREYIETALLAQKLGKNIFIVIDRYEELQLVVQALKKVKVEARLGFRIKLNSPGSGKWAGSCGAHSKFGLTPPEVLQALSDLKSINKLNSLQMLHFHLGSQIPSIQCIKAALKEAMRFYTEVKQLGAPLKYIDVGGGLGVNYDGSKQSDSSCNYSEQEYANDVVSIIKAICDEKQVPHPHIVSESGRALVAHSSMLVFDVLGSNQVGPNTLSAHQGSLSSGGAQKVTVAEAIRPEASDSPIVKDLFEIYTTLGPQNINEYYNDLIEKRTDALNLFSYGALNLVQMAKADRLYWAACRKMSRLMQQPKKNGSSGGVSDDWYWALQKQCSQTYYCNFSVFQSLPDSWATKQVFPVMPLQRLDEKPSNKVTLADLTCDSDGQLKTFIDTDTYEVQNFIEAHNLQPDESYYMGVFLIGAYQETLGDLHNLFGDTNAVHISLKKPQKNKTRNYSIDHVVKGDSVADLLGYLSYNRDDLLEQVRQHTEQGISSGRLQHSEAHQLLKHYEQSLQSYTYLE